MRASRTYLPMRRAKGVREGGLSTSRLPQILVRVLRVVPLVLILLSFVSSAA